MNNELSNDCGRFLLGAGVGALIGVSWTMVDEEMSVKSSVGYSLKLAIVGGLINTNNVMLGLIVLIMVGPRNGWRDGGASILNVTFK